MKTYHERSVLVAEKLKHKKKIRKAVTGGCTAGLALVLALVLFLPFSNTPPSVAQYADSPYYNVIQKINALNYRPPEYANNFERLWGEVNHLKGEIMVNAPGAEPMPDSNGSVAEEMPGYQEVTDNQVAGVTEADIFKRSDKYIYYLHGTDLRVYEIAGEESKEVGSYQVGSFDGKTEQEIAEGIHYSNTAEMYLSMDCTTVTLVLNGYTKSTGTVTVIMNLDVTDPQNIREMDYVCFEGDLISTRLVEGKLLLAYNFRKYASDIHFAEPETFVPSYGKPGNMVCLDSEDILCPDTADNTSYTVIAQLDSKTLAVEDTKALMSYAQELYVSENTIYATHSYSDKQKVGANEYSTQAMTRITGIAYGGDRLQYQGSIDIVGNVKDQYAMDEFEGILRVVTNTSYSVYEEHRGDYHISAKPTPIQRNVSLYCIDLKAWEVKASVLGFAPAGERAESVRFDGNTGYVCTAEVITLTDPVYFFDLSDLDNITCTDTGTIDGYSSSLIQLGEGFLMGIGYGDSRQLKIEVYREYQDEVISVAVWEEEADFSEEYKSYFIDRENDLVGLALKSWNFRGECEYLLLHFDGYTLNEVMRMEMNGSAPETVRACIIDGFLYVLDYTGLLVEKVW